MQVQSGGFIRNVQVTTGVGGTGTVFIAGMNEGTGGVSPRQNIVYRSTNGGTTWSPVTMGPTFTPPGVSNCSTNSYFRGMFNTPTTGYWRYMGWGDIGAGPSGIIHYAYTQDGAGADAGDIYYTRSTDNGLTWSPGIKIDGDGSARSQWMPSLSAAPTATGHVMISWYDARNTTGDDLERWGRVSADNGATWSNAEVISDVVSPKPLQPDPNVQACYAGDYDRSYSNTANHYSAWVDGRVSVGGTAQQNVFFDKVSVGPPPPPAPNLVHDLATVFDDGDGVIEPGESFGLDERIRNAGNAGATGISGVLTSSTPGITISTGNSAYPDLAPGGERDERHALPGVSLGRSHLRWRGQLHARPHHCSGTVQRELHVPKQQCGYEITTQTAQPIIPGTANVGNSGDDVVTPITFPFPVTIYGEPHTAGTVSSNGEPADRHVNALPTTTLPADPTFGMVLTHLLGRPPHGRGFRRDLHRRHGHPAGQAVRDRVANPLLLGRRHGELRDHLHRELRRHPLPLRQRSATAASRRRLAFRRARWQRISSRATPPR